MMPYDNRSQLPKGVQDNLPTHAQDIFKEAFNNAWDQSAETSKRCGNTSQEEAAMRVAWAAVKQKYEKGRDDKWHPKK